jgi:hypothetical protein
MQSLTFTSLFVQLLQDDTPMVRRSATKAFGVSDDDGIDLIKDWLINSRGGRAVFLGFRAKGGQEGLLDKSYAYVCQADQR